MDDYHQIEAKLQRNFHLLPFSAETTGPIFTNFTQYSGISGATKSCIYTALVHSVSERQSNEWRWSIFNFLRLPKCSKINLLPSLEVPQNLCHFCNLHTCDNLRWKADEDQSSSCWDIRSYMPIFAVSSKKVQLIPSQSLGLLDQMAPKLDDWTKALEIGGRIDVIWCFIYW